MKQKLLLFLCLFFAFAIQVMAQEKTVSGRVTDPDTGEGIPGVSVFVKGTTSGTVTDASGNYTLTASEGATIVFQSVGLGTQEIVVGAQSSINVQMTASTEQLNEIVIVAYGLQTKREITGSIASVGSETIKNRPLTGLDQALQGTAAGVQVTQNSGTPGSGIAVRVRGSSSILASNEPLYVVDGIPLNTGSFSSIGIGNQQTSALNDISPNDIESIEVLKDASAASLYGSRAANGVVLITTKRGKAGKTKINFNYYGGVQETWKRLTPVTGADEVRLLQEMLVNRYGTLQSSNFYTFPAFTGASQWESPAHFGAWFFGPQTGLGLNAGGRVVVVEPNPFPVSLEGIRTLAQFQNPESAFSTNWQSEIFRTAPIHNFELSLNGGSDKTTFAVTTGYFSQDGIIKGSGFKRLNGRINIDHEATKKIKVGMSTGFSRSVNTRINNDNNIFGVLSTAILLASDIPVRRSDGVYGRDPSSSIENPLAAATEMFNEAISNRLLNNIYAQYEFIPGLSLRTSWSVDYLYFREDRFAPTTTNEGLSANGSGIANAVQEVNWINENTLNYRKTFAENHNFSALLGASFQESRYNRIQAAATGFPGNDIRELTAASVRTVASTDATSWALTSFFSRFNYDFKGKYLFSFSVRADGSSRFSEDNRYGFFPSVSAGWNIAEESFLENVEFLSQLKLRGSYGVTGNQNFNNFEYFSLFAAGTNYLQQPGFAPAQLENAELKWETTNQLDIGMDIGLFDKVNISVDYYKKKTIDMLLNRPIPSISGFNTITSNIGNIQNEGFEVTIDATPVRTESGFTWNSNFNIAFNRNKILKLADDVPPFLTGFANRVEVGQSLGSFFGYKTNGIFQTQEEINSLDLAAQALYGATARFISSATRPGDFNFQDLNGDGVITGDDQTYLGSAQPDFIGGWTNTLSFKGIDLTIFLQFVYGNEIYNNTRAFSAGMNSVFGQMDEVLGRWTPSNPSNTVPRAVWGDPSNNRRGSDRWLEDGSFLRFKNVTLGYTFPADWVKKAYLSSLRIYVAAQNLFTITDYSGLDPEVNTFSGANASLGTDFLTFPQARTFTFGVNIGF